MTVPDVSMQRIKQNPLTDVNRRAGAQSWAVRLAQAVSAPKSNLISAEARHQSVADSIAHLRLLPGVHVLIDGDAVWLRGDELDDRLSCLLRSLPDAERFLVTIDGELTAWGETVPRASLPVGTWEPIAHWLSVEIPTAAFAAQIEQRIPLRLVRSDDPFDANLLRTTWPIWRDYAMTAPQIRLNQWSFAVSDSDDVLIRGQPLPPIPGQRLVERSSSSRDRQGAVGVPSNPAPSRSRLEELPCVAIPAGWRFDPPIDTESVGHLLPLNPGDLVVFGADSSMELIPESVFVRATRSAIRLTDDAMRTPRDG